jgi:hypothetical protein
VPTWIPGTSPGDDKPPPGEDKPPPGEDKPPPGEDKPPHGEDKPPHGEDKRRVAAKTTLPEIARVRASAYRRKPLERSLRS